MRHILLSTLIACSSVFSNIQAAGVYEFQGIIGSDNRIGIIKEYRLNSFVSIIRPVYDFSWNSSFYENRDLNRVSFNGILTIPSSIYEFHLYKTDGEGKERKSHFTPLAIFALLSLPVILPNMKLRFEPFEWNYLDIGLDTDFFFTGKSDGEDMKIRAGGGIDVHGFNAGLFYVHELIHNKTLPKPSILSGRIGYVF